MSRQAPMVAFVPARSGSKRVPNKNIRMLGDLPVLCWTIRLAARSNLFDEIILVTDSQEYVDVCGEYVDLGQISCDLRPQSSAQDKSPDIDWLSWAFEHYGLNLKYPGGFDFSILRPTNPFRSVEFLQSGLNRLREGDCDSVRAVEAVTSHPGKMWAIPTKGRLMTPILPYELGGVPWHSCQTSSLPQVYQQTASLECAHSYVVTTMNSIAGSRVAPLLTTNSMDSFDINTEMDFRFAEFIVSSG